MSGPRDLAELEARAKAGDAQSQYVLSAILSRQGRTLDAREWPRRALALVCALGVNSKADWLKAMELLVNAALAGHGPALRDVGLLIEMAAPGDPRATVALLRAARALDGVAAFAVMRREATITTGVSQTELTQWTE